MRLSQGDVGTPLLWMSKLSEAQRGPVLFLRSKATSLILTSQLGRVLETTEIAEWGRTCQNDLGCG